VTAALLAPATGLIALRGTGGAIEVLAPCLGEEMAVVQADIVVPGLVEKVIGKTMVTVTIDAIAGPRAILLPRVPVLEK
jgi:hypothetical protein